MNIKKTMFRKSVHITHKPLQSSTIILSSLCARGSYILHMKEKIIISLSFLCITIICIATAFYVVLQETKKERDDLWAAVATCNILQDEQSWTYFTWKIVCFDENWLWWQLTIIDKYEQTDNIVFWSWFDFVKQRCEKVK